MYDSVAEVFWQQTVHVEIYIVLINTTNQVPDKITLHFSVLMIGYLVATSYELWMLYFEALMTIAAKIIVEKSICVW